MYKCEICKRIIGPHVPATHLVIETCKVTFPFRKNAHTIKVEGKAKKVDDPGGTGEQIVKEILACPDCSEKRRR